MTDKCEYSKTCWGVDKNCKPDICIYYKYFVEIEKKGIKKGRESMLNAPTDNGIPELDSLCESYNKGEIDLCALVCRVWNTALTTVEYNKQ